MTTTQAANLIGCSVSYLKSLIRSKRIRAVKIKTTTNRHGYVYDVDRDSVRAFSKLPHSTALGRSKGN